MLGAILGAAASAGGVLSDLYSGYQSRKQARKELAESKRQFEVQDDYNKNMTQYRVQDALKAGINPLAALGTSANYSPTVHAGGSDGGAAYTSRAGDRLQNMIERITVRDTADEARYKKESRDLDLESKRIENQINRAKLAALQEPGKDEVPPTNERILFYPTYDLQGRPRLLVNQDATENDGDNAGYRSALISAFTSGQIDPFSGKVKSNQLRMLIDDEYYRATGHHIHNLDELYVSPAEAGIVAGQTLGDIVGAFVGRR